MPTKGYNPECNQSIALDQDADVDQLISVVNELTERVTELERENERLQTEVEQLRDDRADSDARLSAVSDGLSHAHERIDEIEDDIDSVEQGSVDTTGGQTGGDAIDQSETPLEQIIRVPEHMAEDSLSANQERARFVASGIHEYSRSVPAGRAIKSSEIRKVLSAGEGEGERVYTETVSRVIDFLTELGKDDVQIRETRGGERVVVFTDEFVKRVVAYHNRSNAVVTERGATG